jgi:ketosteroid isomerase-like protein
MTAGNGKATATAEISALSGDQAKAIRAKDIDGSGSNYAPDVLLFDVVNPLQRTGSDAARKRLAEWFASFRGPIGYELRDLSITTGDDVAFCHSPNRVRAATTDGPKLDMWWRATVCSPQARWRAGGHPRACLGAFRGGERASVA